jgi:DNA-binding MurR/RpiR family transcriptional regulator
VTGHQSGAASHCGRCAGSRGAYQVISIEELAQTAEVFQAVSRFVRAVGPDSCQDFRIMLAAGAQSDVGPTVAGRVGAISL